MLVDILRHGQPQGGEVLRGRVDHPLADEGWRQMYASTGINPAQASLESAPWTRVICSPLQRCRQFAEKISADLKLPLSVEPDWQEIDYGIWDGMPVAQWRKEAAEQFKAFRQDMTALSPPQGESFVCFRDRVLTVWHQLSTTLSADEHVLLITHGGVMRVILPTVLGIPLNQTGVLHIPFACLSRIEVGRRDDQPFSTLLFHNSSLSARLGTRPGSEVP
ncbi:MAG: histidine phosphatase family protein [Pseudohongiellaceae bacterium]